MASSEATTPSLWEKMIIEERKTEAVRRGVRVCDLEEETQLSLALEESLTIRQNSERVARGQNASILNANNSPSKRTVSFQKAAVTNGTDLGSGCKQDDGDESQESDYEYKAVEDVTSIGHPTFSATVASKEAVDILTTTPLSQWQTRLPHDVADRILVYLGDADMCGYLNMVAKTNCFYPSETVYKFLCELTYLTQSKKKLIVVENWKSWRNMLVSRPRLRTNGFYCLRTLYSKAPSNDAFWEEKRYESVEVSQWNERTIVRVS
jgi:hypothetical protein